MQNSISQYQSTQVTSKDIGTLCTCAIGSLFTCPQITISIPPSVTYRDCTITLCHRNNGCGFAWSSDCNGGACDTIESKP